MKVHHFIREKKIARQRDEDREGFEFFHPITISQMTICEEYFD